MARYPGRRQPINAGSYVRVPASPALQALSSFTLEALIWPTTPGRGTQTLLGRWDEARQAGYALIIDEAGAVALRLGDGSSEIFSTAAPLDARAWYLVSASYDAQTKGVRVTQQPLRQRARDQSAATLATTARVVPKASTATPFLMAAHVAGEAGRQARHGRALQREDRGAAAGRGGRWRRARRETWSRRGTSRGRFRATISSMFPATGSTALRSTCRRGR